MSIETLLKKNGYKEKDESYFGQIRFTKNFVNIYATILLQERHKDHMTVFIVKNYVEDKEQDPMIIYETLKRTENQVQAFIDLAEACSRLCPCSL